MKNLPEDEQLIAKLRGHQFCSVHTEDHPEFKKFRELLGMQGYIEIQRSWINGDVVLKDFYLNGYRFKKGDQFPCASALGNMKLWIKQH